MSSQIFKTDVPVELLFDFLRKICKEEDSHYLLSKVSFQQAKYHELVEPFCESLKEYYHTSKQYYVTRQLDYSKFVTIIRQICRANQVSYTSKIIYNKSSYDILYYIYKE